MERHALVFAQRTVSLLHARKRSLQSWLTRALFIRLKRLPLISESLMQALALTSALCSLRLAKMCRSITLVIKIVSLPSCCASRLPTCSKSTLSQAVFVHSASAWLSLATMKNKALRSSRLRPQAPSTAGRQLPSESRALRPNSSWRSASRTTSTSKMPFTLLFSHSRIASRESSLTRTLRSESSELLIPTKSSRFSLPARSRTTYVRLNEEKCVNKVHKMLSSLSFKS